MGYGDWSMEGVLLGANLGHAIVTNRDLLSQRCGPLPKLLWADLFNFFQYFFLVIVHAIDHAGITVHNNNIIIIRKFITRT